MFSFLTLKAVTTRAFFKFNNFVLFCCSIVVVVMQKVVVSTDFENGDWAFANKTNEQCFPSYCMRFSSLEDTLQEVNLFIQSQNTPYVVGFKSKGFGAPGEYIQNSFY